MLDETLKWLRVGNTILETAGHLSSAKATALQSQRVKVSKDFETWQLQQQAAQEFAASQRLMMEELRNAQYVASRALAVAGASGGGVSDPTVMNIVTNIKSEGAYRAALALYDGEEKARTKRLAARITEIEGNDELAYGDYRKRAYQLEAIGALAEGASSLYARYGVPNSGMTSEG